MLIVDGVKYKLWKPIEEEKEFHPLVKKNYKYIFGEDALYFDLKQKLSSKSGLAGIPDAYVIALTEPKVWYIVENELSSHDVYRHIVGQVTEFMDLIDDLGNQKELVKIFCNEIEQNKELEGYVKKRINKEIFRFLTELLSTPPRIAVIIDKITPELDKALNRLNKIASAEVVQFETYVRENAENIKAHLIKHPQTMTRSTSQDSRNMNLEMETHFFTQFLEKFKEKSQSIAGARVGHGSKHAWVEIPTQKKGLTFYFAKSRRKRFYVDLYISSRDPIESERIFDILRKQQSAIESEIGTELSWEKGHYRKGRSRIAAYKKGSFRDDSQTLETIELWAADMLARFAQAFSPRVEALTVEAKKEKAA